MPLYLFKVLSYRPSWFCTCQQTMAQHKMKLMMCNVEVIAKTNGLQKWHVEYDSCLIVVSDAQVYHKNCKISSAAYLFFLWYIHTYDGRKSLWQLRKIFLLNNIFDNWFTKS